MLYINIKRRDEEIHVYFRNRNSVTVNQSYVECERANCIADNSISYLVYEKMSSDHCR